MAKNRTFYATAKSSDGRIVTVMGKQHEEKENQVLTTSPRYVHKGATKFETKITTKKMQMLDLVIAIKHADDPVDEKIANSMLMRRMKRKQFHMSITSPQFMGDDFCMAILEAEAKYIASHVDDFCKKIKSYK